MALFSKPLRPALLVALATAVMLGLPAQAQPRKDTAVLAMTLEPPGLDPTAGAASAIAEITLYNLYETLTKITSDSRTVPLLAERWQTSPDLKTWTFTLRRDAKFHNGEPFNAQAVKFSFERPWPRAAPTRTAPPSPTSSASARPTPPPWCCS